MRNFFNGLFNKQESKHKEQNVNGVVVQHENVGSTGTVIFSGESTEEYLQKLQGSERAVELDKVRRSDPQAKMCLSAIKTPIKQATTEFTKPKNIDDELYDKMIVLLERNLFHDMRTPWSKFLNEATTVIEFGHSVFELTFQNHLESPIGPYTGLKDLSWRSPKTIERFNLDEDGFLASVTQMADGDLDRNVDIDARFIMHIGLDVEGSNYEGISLLRPCYGNWYRKQKYLKLNAIGIEKFAIPTPVVDVPQGKEGTQEYSNLIRALTRYTTHQNNYLIKPAGWEIDLNTNTYDPQKVEISIDNEDKRMVKAFLANFLELGMNGTGSYALSNDLSDFFLSGIEYIADTIAEALNTSVIKPLIKMNFGAQEEYPEIKFTGISDKAGEELAKIITMLNQSGVLTADDRLEDSLRERFKLPERDEASRRVMEAPTEFNLSEKIDRAFRENGAY